MIAIQPPQYLSWTVGIVTATRPGRSTLPATIQSVRDAGWTGTITVSREPGTYVSSYLHAIVTHDHRGQPGPYRNWLNLLRVLVEEADPGDRLLVLEDDLELSGGLRSFLDLVQPLPDGLTSLYCAAPLDSGKVEVGWRPVEVPIRAYGALAYTFTRELAQRFLKSCHEPHPTLGTDHLVGRWCRDQGVPYRVSTPSFARHRGSRSCLPSAGTPEARQCGRFVRECWPDPQSPGAWRLAIEPVGPTQEVLVCPAGP